MRAGRGRGLHRAKVGRRGEPTNPAATTPAPLHAVRHTLATGGKGAGGGGAPEEEEQPAPSGAAAQPPLGSSGHPADPVRLAVLEVHVQAEQAARQEMKNDVKELRAEVRRVEDKVDNLSAAQAADTYQLRLLILAASVFSPFLPKLLPALLSKLL